MSDNPADETVDLEDTLPSTLSNLNLLPSTTDANQDTAGLEEESAAISATDEMCTAIQNPSNDAGIIQLSENGANTDDREFSHHATCDSTADNLRVLATDGKTERVPSITSYFAQTNSPDDDPFGSIASAGLEETTLTQDKKSQCPSSTVKSSNPNLRIDVSRTASASLDELAMQFSPPITREEMTSASPLDDVMTSSADLFNVQTADLDRMYDAWIPSEVTKRTLMQLITSSGTYQLTLDMLTRPKLAMNDLQTDPVLEQVYRLKGEQEAQKRQVLNMSKVSQDMIGLKQLIESGCWRSALDLTGVILSLMGQGVQTIESSQITPESIKVWACRIALLTKLKLYNIAEAECQQFGNMDSPDMYFEYHTYLSPTLRKGSIVPFNLRLLHSCLPLYLGRHKESLDRLFHIVGCIHKILHNLHSDLAEDGSATVVSDSSRKASIQLWRRRELQTMHSLATCFTDMKDYRLALQQYEQIITHDPQHACLTYSTMGRLCIQMGALEMATPYFNKSIDKCQDKALKEKLTHMHKGYTALCECNYSEAPAHFNTAASVDQGNIDVLAKTNAAVSMLYSGQLKTAMLILEELVYSNPRRYMQECILLNLCTLYELESNMSLNKKHKLLLLANEHVGNGFNINSLKISG